jgi:hydrogenase nickel incorporation protein HypA/HybF
MMHEFSLADSILSVALEEARKHKAKRIKKMEVDVGELSMASLEQLDFALQSLAVDTMAEGMKVKLRVVPAKFSCERGHVSKIKLKGPDLYFALATLRCPKCKGALSVVGGKECILKRIVAE